VTLLAEGQGCRLGATLLLGRRESTVNYVLNDPDYIQLSCSTLSELAVPILEGDTPVGVLNLECDKKEGFDQADEATVVGLASLAAIALQNSRERMLDAVLQL
jgi:putative methionine-R-sulfoxide reductase with GAF domain